MNPPAKPHTAGPEGALEQITRSGPIMLHATGWARDAANAAPVQVEILVNDVVRATVTAHLARPNGETNGFSASLPAPSQPARVCARTVAVAPAASVDLGCLNLSHAVPIRIVGRAGTTPPPQVATFFRVAPDGAIEQELVTVPIQNGQAVYAGDPLPPGARWAITVHDPGGLPIFRSGPLTELPGPVSPVVLTSHISIFRSDEPGGFGLDSPDGAPEIARQSLQHLPPSLSSVRIDQVVFSGDAAGHEIVKVIGRMRVFFFWWRPFTFARLVTLRPDPHPGRPASIALFDSGGPDVATGAPLGNLAPALSAAIGGAILAQLNAALQQIATLQDLAYQIDFPANLVSATSLKVTASASAPQLQFIVHGGTISPGLGGVNERSESPPV